MSQDNSKSHKGELPIDWCPICGDKLSDNKKSTRIDHDKKYHPLYSKSQLVRDVKTNWKKLLKIFLIVSIVAIIMAISVEELNKFSSSLNIDCAKVKIDLSNYTKIHGLDKHVLQEMNSTSECGFVLALNYSKIKVGESDKIQSCNDCVYIYSYYSNPNSQLNTTKLNETFSFLKIK